MNEYQDVSKIFHESLKLNRIFHNIFVLLESENFFTVNY